MKGEKGYTLIAQAFTGILAMTGQPGGEAARRDAGSPVAGHNFSIRAVLLLLATG